MRVVGWLLTALGCAGFTVLGGELTIAVIGDPVDPGPELIMSLFTVAISCLLILTGGRLRARSKPLLPIALSS
jgi:hypothetical protein